MTLGNILQELAKQIIALCEDWKKDGKIRKEPRIYVKHKIENFEYKSGGISCSGSFPNIIKEEWNSGDIFRLIETVKKEVSLFKNSAKVIADLYSTSEPQAEFWLSRFVQKLIMGHLEDKVDTTIITDLIITFIGDLEDNPLEWKIKVWLEGVWMDIEEMDIEKGILIRKPQPDDLEYEHPIDTPLFSKELMHYPSAILEINKRVKVQPYLYPELEKVLSTLQLYKIGAVNKIRIEWKPKSILQISGVSSPTHAWATAYKYPLTTRDVNLLPKFIETIKHLLPTDDKTGAPLPSNPVGIAILRYQDSLFKPEGTENKIAYSVMGLEALYLKAKEREELSHRLAQRIAKILEFFNEPPIKTYNIVKEAYEIRSNFVHGSPLQTEEPQKTKEILDKVIELLRKSILVFLQIGKEKEDFLSLIDNAILETQAGEKLQNLMKENILILGGRDGNER